MLLVIAGFFTLLFGVLLIVNVQIGLLSAYLFKPIIDASWASQIGGISMLDIVGVLFPLILIIKSFASQNRLTQMPLFAAWLIYLVYNLLTYSFHAIQTSPLDAIELGFRLLNGFVAFYAVQAFLSDAKGFRRLLVVLIIAGLFPMLMGIYQAITGTVWQHRTTVGLIRNVGVYHDAVALRHFAFQTLTAIILYWAYFLPPSRSVVRKAFLVGLTCVTLVVMYKLFSKAALIVMALWLLIWTISYRRIGQTIVLALAGMMVFAIFSEEIVREISQLFSKEIAALDEEATAYEQQRSLAGRWYDWAVLVTQYMNRPFLSQLFGNGDPSNAHNDFLAKLLSGGVVGLFIYLILLGKIGVRLFGNWWRRRSPLDVMAVMIFTLLLVDSVGITPTLYTTYQWYVWGFLGLALKGIEADRKVVTGPATAEDGSSKSVDVAGFGLRQSRY